LCVPYSARPPQQKDSGLTRRDFARAAGSTGLLALAGTVGAMWTPETVQAKLRATGDANQRRSEAFAVRRQAALAYLQEQAVVNNSNGDEARYTDKRANFFKGLPQNRLGEVDPSAYASPLRALSSADPNDSASIPLAAGSARKLANPQAAFAFDMVGKDSHTTGLPPPPRFASAEAAAEIGEIYWLALCREVPFREFDSSRLTNAAVDDLNRFSRTVGPKIDGLVTTGTLFRGETPGDLVGPYLSQFLWQDVPCGPSRIVQRYRVPLPGVDFMTE